MRSKRPMKNKKITILQRTESTMHGESLNEYEPVPGCENIWAYYRHVSGKEFFAAQKTNSRVEVMFEINYRKGLDTYMKIKYNNELYEITQIDDFEGNRTDLKISAYKID